MKKTKTIKKKSPEGNAVASWFKLFQFLLGLFISWQGIQKLTYYPQNWWYGAIAQAIGGCLILYSFPKTSAVLEWSGHKEPKNKSADKKARKSASWVLIAVLIFLSLSSYEFYQDSFYWASFFAFLVVGLVVFAKQQNAADEREKAEFDFSEKKWFWVLMVFAAVLRFACVRTNLTGLQGDEGNNLTDTIGIGWGHYSPFETAWGGTPILPYYYYVILFKIFGAKLWVARLGTSFASLGAIYFFYRWIRLWFSPLASLLGAFWLAVSWWFFYFSISPFHNSILAMEEIGAFYFMEKGLRTGQRGAFCLAGLFTAGCVMNYVSGRGVPVMLILVLAAYVLLRGWAFVKTYWKQLILCLVSFWWFAGPFLVYACIHPAEVWGRVQPGWIAQEFQHSGSYWFLSQCYGWSLATLWAVNHSVDFRFVVPGMTFMDAVTGVFALLGACVCLTSWKKPLTWVLLAGLFMGLSANALARLGWPADFAYIQLVRLSIVIPFVFLMAVWGLDWFLKFYRKFYPKGWGWSGLLVIIAVLGPLALNEPVFLSRFAFEPSTWGEHGLSYIKLSEIIKKESVTHELMVDPDGTSNAVSFLIRDDAPEPKGFDIHKDLPVLYQAHKNVMLVFPPWRITEEQRNTIHKFYPKAVWTNYASPWNDGFIVTVDLPLDEVLAAQKGKRLLGPLS
jgi:hypothetical protein